MARGGDRSAWELLQQRMARVRDFLDRLGILRRLRLGWRRRFRPFGTEMQRGRCLFFVTGRSKSGTTWMGKLLNSHPELFCDEWENHAFQQDRRVSFFEEDPDAMHGQAQRFFHRRTSQLLKQGLLLNLIYHCDKRSARMLGDKSPRQDVEAALAAFPEGRVIVMLRDFRDVCVSQAFHRARYTGTWEMCFEGPDRKALDDRLLRVHLGNYERRRDFETHRRLAAERPDQVRIVRYEDLKAAPHATLAAVLRHLGVQDSEEFVDRCIRENTFQQLSRGRKPGQADVGSFYRKGIVGDWRNHFSASNVATFKEIAGRTLIAAGYEADDNWGV